MQINTRSLQDMHIFGDPSRVPIVFVERVMNAPRRTFSDNSYLRNLDLIDMLGSQPGPSSGAGQELPGSSRLQKVRDLKIVVFVHGFQASLIFVMATLKFVGTNSLFLWFLVTIFLFSVMNTHTHTHT